MFTEEAIIVASKKKNDAIYVLRLLFNLQKWYDSYTFTACYKIKLSIFSQTNYIEKETP